MAKVREIPCRSYVCAGESCLSGRKNVFHNNQCQTCLKYRPRKTGNHKSESVQAKRDKAARADARKQMREW